MGPECVTRVLRSRPGQKSCNKRVRASSAYELRYRSHTVTSRIDSESWKLHRSFRTYGTSICVRSRRIICSFMACSSVGVSYEMLDFVKVLIAYSEELGICLNRATLLEEEERTRWLELRDLTGAK